MHKEFLMGNEAIALGALAAGVTFVSGYPGTPSTEVLETIIKRKTDNVYVEWSVNEKAAMECAAGAAYCGARALVTMKQVGLNVASDPLMSLEYIGVKGGMVILVADDPGPISSQTEQDTRTFGMYSKVPVFDPSSVEEAYEMMQEAYEISEKYHTPVFFRPTTRIDHGYQDINIKDANEYHKTCIEGFVKDSSKWVIFPKLSIKNHGLIEKRNDELSSVFSDYKRNEIIAETAVSERKIGVAAHGISYDYVMDNLAELGGSCPVRVLKVATPFPFPDRLALEFLDRLDEVICVEELDPVIERALISIAGKYHLDVIIRGKLTDDMPRAGENSAEIVREKLEAFAESNSVNLFTELRSSDLPAPPELPIRPPVLCAGCPHRASFYAVKKAMKGKKTIYCGDIGCYTLGNAKPLDMCDTCLCMGAGITIAQGVQHVEPDTNAFAFVGDSTFFASGITGIVNAYYNQANLTVCILDNYTTAMTGQQPHPGTGHTAMGENVKKVNTEMVLRGIGLTTVETVNPLDHDIAVETVKRVAAEPGVKAIIFKSPCVVYAKPKGHSYVDPEKCVGCKRCINELGCPGLTLAEKKAVIDNSLCTGCTLCEQVCPFGAISGGDKNEQ